MMVRILPKEGNLVAQRIMRDIIQKTEINQEDMEKVGMEVVKEGGVIWDENKEKELGQKPVKFTDAEMGYLKDQVKKLDETQKVTREAFLLCEKIHNLKGKQEMEEEEEEKEENAPS